MDRPEAALRLTGVSTADDAEGPPLDRLSLHVRAGEIVGVAGVEGNGQRTLVRALAGLVEVTGGEILLGGTAVTTFGLARRRAVGLRIIPFDRNAEGLSLTSPLWVNWSAGALLQRPLLAPIRPSRLQRRCADALHAWDVHFTSAGQPARLAVRRQRPEGDSRARESTPRRRVSSSPRSPLAGSTSARPPSSGRRYGRPGNEAAGSCSSPPTSTSCSTSPAASW